MNKIGLIYFIFVMVGISIYLLPTCGENEDRSKGDPPKTSNTTTYPLKDLKLKQPRPSFKIQEGELFTCVLYMEESNYIKCYASLNNNIEDQGEDIPSLKILDGTQPVDISIDADKLCVTFESRTSKCFSAEELYRVGYPQYNPTTDSEFPTIILY